MQSSEKLQEKLWLLKMYFCYCFNLYIGLKVIVKLILPLT